MATRVKFAILPTPRTGSTWLERPPSLRLERSRIGVNIDFLMRGLRRESRNSGVARVAIAGLGMPILEPGYVELIEDAARLEKAWTIPHWPWNTQSPVRTWETSAA